MNDDQHAADVAGPITSDNPAPQKTPPITTTVSRHHRSIEKTMQWSQKMDE